MVSGDSVSAREQANLKAEEGDKEEDKKKKKMVKSGEMSTMSPLFAFSGSIDQDSQDRAMSPFSRIQVNLESLVNEIEIEDSPPNRPLGTARLDVQPPPGTATPSIGSTATPRKRSGAGHLEFCGNSPHHVASSVNESLPTRSLWIGNLDPTLTEDDLRHTFGPFGRIESLRLLPSKECAFVNYYSVEDAINAKNTMNGTSLGSLIVRIGYGKADAGTASLQPSSGTSGCTPGQTLGGALPVPAGGPSLRSVWIGQIGPKMDRQLLYEAFQSFGPIESCRILEGKNCAFVNYFNTEHANAARKAMNGARLGSSIIKTGYAKTNTYTNNLGAPSETVLVNKLSEPINGNSLGLMQKNLLGSGSLLSIMQNVTSAASGNSDEEDSASFSARDVPESEFRHPIPPIPPETSLPACLNSTNMRECRRRVEQLSVSVEDVEELTNYILPYIVVVSIDPVGNILVQKLIERGSDTVREGIMHHLGSLLAAVGIHKHGTWVVQKLINFCQTPSQRATVGKLLRPHLVPLMQDQFGNYVVQCCLCYGPAFNKFIWDALYHRCVDIGTSRFGSRAMKSCLESPYVTKKQQKFVAMAIINHAVTLVHDVNGVIVLQWLLDSDLPGRFAFVAPVLRNHFAALCHSKHANSVVAKLVQPASEASARNAVIEELFFGKSNLSALLQEPMAAAILYRALITCNGVQKIKMCKVLEEHLCNLPINKLTHLKRLTEDVEEILARAKVGDTPDEGNTTFAPKRETLLWALSPGPSLASQVVGGPVSDPTTSRPLRRGPHGGTAVFRVSSIGESSYNKVYATLHGSDQIAFGPGLLNQQAERSKGQPKSPS